MGQKLRHLSVYLCFCLLFGVTACTLGPEREGSLNETSDSQSESSPPPSQDDPRQRLSGADWLKSDKPLTISAAKQILREAHQVRSDKRFLMAVCDIHCLLTGLPKAETEISLCPQGWLVKFKNKEVGRLRELADFEEQYMMLRNWAKRQKEFNTKIMHTTAGKSGTINARNEVSPEALFKLLGENDAKLKKADWDKETLQATSTALCLLYFQCLDLLQSADPLSARAIAAVALAEELGGLDETRNLCLLSQAMGYFGYAQSKAKRLDDTDTIKHFIDGNKKKLKALADAPAASAQTKYFYLRLLGNKREKSEWQAKTKSYFSNSPEMTLPLTCGYFDLASEDSILGFSTSVLSALNRSLLHTTDEKHPILQENFSWSYEAYSESQEWVLKDVAKEFEANLQPGAPKAEGFFLDEQIYKQFYRAQFNSAISIISDCYLSMPEGTKFCARLADSLKLPPEAPSGSLERWLRLRIDEREGKASYSSLDSDLFSITSLGTGAVLSLCQGLDLQFSQSDPTAALRFGRKALSNCDSRHKTRIDVALMLENLLLDLHQSCRLLQSSAGNGVPHNFEAAVQQSVFLHSQPKLLNLLQQPQIRPRERLVILHSLEETPSIKASVILNQYQKLSLSAPHDWWATEPLYQLFWKSKHYAQSSNIALKWINNQKSFKFLDEVKARTALAQSLMAQGKAAAGLESLEKTKFSEQFISLAMRALLLEELGKREDAETWAAECVKRYPTEARAISLMAELLWRNGKYSQAAEFLRRSQNSISRTEWRMVIGKAFASVFGKSPLKVELAVNSLIDAGISGADNLGQIAAALYSADCAAAAFSILAKVEVNSTQRADLLVCGYRYLKRWKSEKDAQQWLSTQIPPGFNPIALAPYAFLSGQNELLWLVITDKDLTDDVAILRAASLATDLGSADRQRKESLLKRYAGRTDLPAMIVRYLLSPNGESRLFSSKLENKQISKAAFYVGWKSLLQAGQFLNDLDWYRVSIEHGSEENAEYRWSWIWLSDLQLSLKRFSKLGNASAVDRLHVVFPQSGNWNEQRRFGLSDH